MNFYLFLFITHIEVGNEKFKIKLISCYIIAVETRISNGLKLKLNILCLVVNIILRFPFSNYLIFLYS